MLPQELLLCCLQLWTWLEEQYLDLERIRLMRQGPPERIFDVYLCIAAKVDGEDGKPIELVQRTPKRDKGSMTQPGKRELKPIPTGSQTYAASSGFGTSLGLIGDYLGAPQDGQHLATFDRIQFKKATANNGQRRGAQQYFHIVVELFVKIQKSKAPDADLVKVAQRVSVQMAVRGRSPSYYSDKTSTHMGPPRDPSYSRPGHSVMYSPGAATSIPQHVSSASMNNSFGPQMEIMPPPEITVETEQKRS